MNTLETAGKFGGSFALGALVGALDDALAVKLQTWVKAEATAEWPSDTNMDNIIQAAVPVFIECAIALGAIAFFAPRAGPTNQLAYTIGVLGAMNVTRFEMVQLSTYLISLS